MITRSLGPFPLGEGRGVLIDARCPCDKNHLSPHIDAIVLELGPQGWQCPSCSEKHADRGDPRIQTGTWTYDLTFNGTVRNNPFLTPEMNLWDGLDLLDEERYGFNDLGNAKRLVHLHGAQFRYAPQLGFLVYDGTRFLQDLHEVFMQRLAATVATKMRRLAGQRIIDGNARSNSPEVQHAERCQSTASLASMVKAARSHPDVTVSLDELDTDPWLLNTPNAVVDLQTGLTRAPSPNDLFTRVTRAEYHPEATAPRWHRFLDEVCMDDAEMVQFLQMAMGYTLTGSTREEVFFFLYGNGSNGKSKFLGAVTHAMGDYAKSVPFEIFLKTKNDDRSKHLAQFPGVRLADSIEAEAGRQWDTAMITTLTGNDTITARHLYQAPFEFRPVAKVWMAANHKPYLRDPTEAFHRRFIPIPFQAHFSPEERDNDLEHILQTERDGILAWMVRGAMLWNDSGWQIPGRVEEARRDYRSDNDTFSAFVDAHCSLMVETGKPEMESASRLLQAYNAFAEDQGERTISARALAGHLENYRGGLLRKERGRSGVVYHGITVHTLPDLTRVTYGGVDL